MPLQKKPSGLIDMSEDILELLCKQNDGAIDFDITVVLVNDINAKMKLVHHYALPLIKKV